MKDLAHHIKKLNRKVIRSMHQENLEEEAYDLTLPAPPARKKSEHQLKKQAKAKMRKEREARTPSKLTPEERNKKMKHRVPVFEQRSPQKGTSSRKKTPRI